MRRIIKSKSAVVEMLPKNQPPNIQHKKSLSFSFPGSGIKIPKRLRLISGEKPAPKHGLGNEGRYYII